MKITIEIPDHAAEMLKDLAGALQTIAATVTVEKVKKETKQLDAFQKLADENKPKVTIQDVRAIMAELLRERSEERRVGKADSTRWSPHPKRHRPQKTQAGQST